MRCTASSAAPRPSTRRASIISTSIRTRAGARFFLHYGDMTDATNLIRIVQEVQPDEIYNLAAQSHVKVSFETPEYTANADGLGTLRLLEAIRILKMEEKTRFYQASTSELYGMALAARSARPPPSCRRAPTPRPSSTASGSPGTTAPPTACTPRTAFLFNHESPIRGETFVTRKITRGSGRDRAGAAGAALYRQPRGQARLGPCPGLCAGHVADPPAGRARRLCAGHRRGA